MNLSSQDSSRCGECGASVSLEAVGGLCVACLLASAMIAAASGEVESDPETPSSPKAAANSEEEPL